MRKIEFRGKDFQTGEWRYGDLRQRLGHLPSIVELYFKDKGKVAYREVSVKENTVSQYTGLCDKSGKGIYEGDILVCGSWVGVVLWNEELATFALQFDFEDKVGSTSLGKWQTMKIVDNIYDNPELLKETRLIH